MPCDQQVSWFPPACGVTSPPAYYCEPTMVVISALRSFPAIGLHSTVAVQVSVMPG